jgi:hypothetical protein
MGRNLILWLFGMAALYLFVLALAVVMPYLIGLSLIGYVLYRIHLWLVAEDEKKTLR